MSEMQRVRSNKQSSEHQFLPSSGHSFHESNHHQQQCPRFPPGALTAANISHVPGNVRQVAGGTRSKCLAANCAAMKTPPAQRQAKQPISAATPLTHPLPPPKPPAEKAIGPENPILYEVEAAKRRFSATFQAQMLFGKQSQEVDS
ncbi:Hypothetical predicted protein [Podarcis lilfordi]|uniref:Uncharacterized protein n=1 Tax=Podarcis lilfordi TaxID=74358 RepID=A0AA35P9L7_9SAUR|nr:Hypothetical predicted protein [Podarcis lilfordi]